MQALSVRQPYAGLIVSGLKTIECRLYPTKFRGRLIICSSLTWAAGDYEIPDDVMWAYPVGCAVGAVDIIGCVPFTADHLEAAAMSEIPDRPAWAWQLANPIEFDPIPVTGKLGIFNLPDEIADQIKKMIQK